MTLTGSSMLGQILGPDEMAHAECVRSRVVTRTAGLNALPRWLRLLGGRTNGAPAAPGAERQPVTIGPMSHMENTRTDSDCGGPNADGNSSERRSTPPAMTGSESSRTPSEPFLIFEGSCQEGKRSVSEAGRFESVDPHPRRDHEIRDTANARSCATSAHRGRAVSQLRHVQHGRRQERWGNGPKVAPRPYQP